MPLTAAANPGHDLPPLRVCIVSGESRSTAGGLSAYARMLVRELQSESITVSTVARFDRVEAGPMDYAAPSSGDGAPIDGIPTNLVGPSPAWAPILRQLHHMTDRRALRMLPPKIFSRAFERSLARALPAECDVIHFIGAGRELLGFAALDAAQAGSGFHHLAGRASADLGGQPAGRRSILPGRRGLLPVAARDSASAIAGRFARSPRARVACACSRCQRRWPRVPPETRAWKAAGCPVRRPPDAHKGFHSLCEAMTKVLETIPDACLIAIGPKCDMPYPPVPARAYLDLGIAGESEKADALAACDVFCMPSTTEAFGIVYVEAWSYGKPVVGGLAPAVRELIADGETGFCVEQDPSAIATALVRLLEDENLRNRLGAAGREIQSTRYNWPAVTQLHLDVFHSLTGYRATSLAPSCAF